MESRITVLAVLDLAPLNKYSSFSEFMPLTSSDIVYKVNLADI